jgi:MOSC domain-containing protein YiiM
MQLLSVSVGRPQIILAQGNPVSSGIIKHPVEGPVMVRATNLDGDRQSDLSVHGGIDKAVYAYPSEYYPLWRAELDRPDLSYGNFGENLTTAGLLDREVLIGDRLQIGDAILVVTQPRLPCFKLAARLNRSDIGNRMVETARHGFYFSVAREGLVAAGDEIRLLERPTSSITVAELAALYLGLSTDPDLLTRAITSEFVPARWKQKFAHRAGV